MLKKADLFKVLQISTYVKVKISRFFAQVKVKVLFKKLLE